MPTRKEMTQAILHYCFRHWCRDCVIYHDPHHITGKCCDSDMQLSTLEHNYNLVINANETNAQEEENNPKKGNDIMSSDIITNEERTYLLSNMERLLDEYDYTYSHSALNSIIDTWATNKADLITAFKKHPNYVEGKFMIAFDQDYERAIDLRKAEYFSQWLGAHAIRKMYLDVPPEIRRKTLDGGWCYLPSDLYYFLTNLDRIPDRIISSEVATEINNMLPNIHAHAGQKTSRIINKICTYLGYDKAPDYNREFARYADGISPMTIKRHTALSLNPLDYLTMSFGNSWASCHTIDKTNKRCMPHSYEGCYSSGTISYMLDPSSMVFYTVDASANGNDLWNEPKINRQMFHYGHEKLVQGRLYPQDNDDCSQGKTLYDQYRNVVQSIMAYILDVPNLWTVSKGTVSASEYIWSEGTHYRDYENYDNCTLSRLKGSQNEDYIDVGHNPICIKCGCEHNCEENICCCAPYAKCSDCGDELNEDEVIWVDDEPYCRDCVNYCERCNEYHRQEEYYIQSSGMYVCEDCFNYSYGTCDNCGQNYDLNELSEVDGITLCNDCLDRDYTACNDCGELISNEDICFYEEDELYLCHNCYEERLEAEADEAC